MPETPIKITLTFEGAKINSQVKGQKEIAFNTWVGRPNPPIPQFEVVNRLGSETQTLYNLYTASAPVNCVATIDHPTEKEAEDFYIELIRQYKDSPRFTLKLSEKSEDGKNSAGISNCYLLSAVRVSCKKMIGISGDVWLSVYSMIVNRDNYASSSAQKVGK